MHTDDPGLSPNGIDPRTPSASGVYDCLLGGGRNFAADRTAAKDIVTVLPESGAAARALRIFARRATVWCREHGIEQFLDLGAGLPTGWGLHTLLTSQRFVCVDIDPVTAAHNDSLLHDRPTAGSIEGDLTHPGAILADPEVRRLLDLDKPLAVLMCGVLHFVPDAANPRAIIRAYRDAVAPGSVLALSHVCDEYQSSAMRQAAALYSDTVRPVYPRSREGIADLLVQFGSTLVETGLTPARRWQAVDASSQPADPMVYAAIAHRGVPE